MPKPILDPTFVPPRHLDIPPHLEVPHMNMKAVSQLVADLQAMQYAIGKRARRAIQGKQWSLALLAYGELHASTPATVRSGLRPIRPETYEPKLRAVHDALIELHQIFVGILERSKSPRASAIRENLRRLVAAPTAATGRFSHAAARRPIMIGDSPSLVEFFPAPLAVTAVVGGISGSSDALGDFGDLDLKSLVSKAPFLSAITEEVSVSLDNPSGWKAGNTADKILAPQRIGVILREVLSEQQEDWFKGDELYFRGVASFMREDRLQALLRNELLNPYEALEIKAETIPQRPATHTGTGDILENINHTMLEAAVVDGFSVWSLSIQVFDEDSEETKALLDETKKVADVVTKVATVAGATASAASMGTAAAVSAAVAAAAQVVSAASEVLKNYAEALDPDDDLGSAMMNTDMVYAYTNVLPGFVDRELKVGGDGANLLLRLRIDYQGQIALQESVDLGSITSSPAVEALKEVTPPPGYQGRSHGFSLIGSDGVDEFTFKFVGIGYKTVEWDVIPGNKSINSGVYKIREPRMEPNASENATYVYVYVRWWRDAFGWVDYKVRCQVKR